MLAAGKWVMGIVTGGLVLGALLGDAADPDMKDPPAPWWQLTGREDIARVNDMQFVEAGPEDLNVFGGYRPDLDYDTEVWALPIPAYELAALADEPLSAPDDALPQVTYGVTAAEQAGDGAEDAAEDALAAEAPAVEPDEGADVRKSELAMAGLY